jgi:hypothetical protein
VTLTVRKNMRCVLVLCALINSLMNEWMNEWMCNHPPSIFTYGPFVRRGAVYFFTLYSGCSRDSLGIIFLYILTPILYSYSWTTSAPPFLSFSFRSFDSVFL